MGFFDFFKSKDINAGVEQYKETKGAVLLDVRTKEEFAKAHVPEAINIPLQEIEEAENRITDLKTPIFVYCLSGARSSQASSMLRQMGYENITNIGGISAYTGEIER